MSYKTNKYPGLPIKSRRMSFACKYELSSPWHDLFDKARCGGKIVGCDIHWCNSLAPGWNGRNGVQCIWKVLPWKIVFKILIKSHWIVFLRVGWRELYIDWVSGLMLDRWHVIIYDPMMTLYLADDPVHWWKSNYVYGPGHKGAYVLLPGFTINYIS